ncbi:MAG: hypothetical protein WB820_18050 [Rhodoplanes sp.]
MKATDCDLNPVRAQRTCDVERARHLVRLNANQHYDASVGRRNERRNALRPYPRIGFVKGVDFYIDVFAERIARSTVLGNAVKRGERI